MMIQQKKYNPKFWITYGGIIWGALCLIYLPCLVQFIYGNHDFQFMRFGTTLTSGMWEGRPAQFLPLWILTDNQVLPIWNLLLAFFFLALSVILWAKFFNLPPKFNEVIPFGLLIVFHPYFLTQIYYTSLFLSFSLWFLLATIGVISASAQNFKYTFLAFICYTLCFSGYLGSLELVLTLLCGLLLFDILSGQLILTELFKKYVRHLLIITFALLSYYFMFLYLKAQQVVDMQMYNIQHAAFLDIIKQLWIEKTTPWKNMFNPFPYLPQLYIYLLFLLIVVTLTIAFLQKKGLRTVLVFILFGYALYALAFLSSSSKLFFEMYRVHCYSIPLFGAILYAAVLHYGKHFFHNIIWVTSLILIFLYGRADVIAQKIWLLGDSQDERIIDRIRADFMPQIQKNKHYRLITLGNLNGRWKFASFPDETFKNGQKFRELFGFAYYLPQFSASGLFLYENYNPIWWTANTFDPGKINFVFDNEFTNKNNPEIAIFFNYHWKNRYDPLTVFHQIHPFPSIPYFFIGEDIYLSYGNGTVEDIEAITSIWSNESETTYPSH